MADLSREYPRREAARECRIDQSRRGNAAVTPSIYQGLRPARRGAIDRGGRNRRTVRAGPGRRGGVLARPRAGIWSTPPWFLRVRYLKSSTSQTRYSALLRARRCRPWHHTTKNRRHLADYET